MSIAPEPILKAGNDTVSWACIFCRNQTLREGAPSKMINDVMEAIHEIPRMLVDWDHHDVAEVRTHLGCLLEFCILRSLISARALHKALHRVLAAFHLHRPCQIIKRGLNSLEE